MLDAIVNSFRPNSPQLEGPKKVYNMRPF